MVRAWYIDNDPSDQRDEHHKNPPQYVTVEELFKLTGVEHSQLCVDTFESDGLLEKVKKERGYSYEDEITCSKDCLPNYEERLKIFYTEHLHPDEEIRFIVDGSGYLDVRDKSDEWIRINIEPGDLLVLPGGIYHRFTLDKKNYIKARRLFIGSPVWTAYYRPADDMDCRKNYLKKFASGWFVKGH